MIQPNAKFNVAGVTGVSVFPDDSVPGGFYALPESPRLALDGSGHPQLRLILHGKQGATEFELSGGLFTCTTSLGLRKEETARLADRLQTRVGRGARVTMLQLTWTAGSCELRLTAGIRVTGQPSLFGDNTCVFQHSLSAASAIELEKEWSDGLPDAVVVYELTSQLPVATFRAEGPLQASREDIRRLISRVDLG
jgi:hypothetical protein